MYRCGDCAVFPSLSLCSVHVLGVLRSAGEVVEVVLWAWRQFGWFRRDGVAGEVGEGPLFEGFGLVFARKRFAAWRGDADPTFGGGNDGH